MAESSVTENRDLAAQYDASYYETHCGPVPYKRSEPQWAAVFGGIADHLIRSIRPRRVLDVGCALGFLVEAFWDRGVEAWGIDVSRFAIDNVRPDLRNYCRVASAEDPIDGGPFDLAACIEVLEHMPERDALLAIRHMAQVTDTILFSSSPHDFAEPTHLNVKPTLYWLRAFQDHGFSPDILFDASFVAPHAMLLRKMPTPHSGEVLRLFGQLLHLRHQVTDRASQINEYVRDLGLARVEIARSVDTIEKLRAEGASLHERAQQSSVWAQQREAETALVREELQRMSTISSQTGLELEKAKAELKTTRTALEQAEQTQNRIHDDLDVSAALITEYMRNDLGAAAKDDANAGTIKLLESRLGAVESQISTVGNAVNNIATSRIWRSLVRGAGLVQRFLPGQHS